jgi:dihydroorotase-like cyclic amidohydrolase
MSGFPLAQFLYHEGHVARGVSIERLVDVTTSSIARTLGIHHRKASFEPGSDADLFVFDPHAPDPYREHRWPGRVIFSLQRGNILLYNGQIHTSAGDGMRIVASCPAE